ncbi:MAG: NfeD family protein [Actinobacteria bacterium]|nr:NfeD family protein [Actinomycetota bacterium]
MDNEMWRWIWLALVVVFGIGEIFTAGFFMLPFAVGAVVAFLLSWFNIPVPVSLVVFLATSVVALVVIQKLVRRSDQRQVPVGANRFVGRTVVVTEQVDRLANTGRVRMDTETWRATTDGPPIEVGAEARVVEVRGTRLVLAAPE